MTEKASALKFQSEIVKKIQTDELDESTNELIEKFMRLLGSTRTRYDINSKSKKIQSLYKKRFEDDVNNIDEIIRISNVFSYHTPCVELLDLAFSIISLLEMIRHDMMIDIIKECIVSNTGFIYLEKDFELSNYFPDIPSKSTPDILFYKEDGTKLIIEVKVTMKTDLELFYRKYKQLVKDRSLVTVINYNLDGFTYYGDLESVDNILQHSQRLDIINTIIENCSKIRLNYKKYPEYTYFSNFYESIEGEDNFITGYKERCKSLDSYEEVVSLFGDKWKNVIYDMDNFSLIDNYDDTFDKLKNSHDDAIAYCNDELNSFNNLYLKNMENGIYTQTNLTIDELGTYQDLKSQEIYQFTDKYKPSVYIPIIKSFKIEKPRSEYYTEMFKNLKPITNNSYLLSVNQILKFISEPNVMQEIINPNIKKTLNNDIKKDKIDKSKSPIHSDHNIDIYINNAFKITNPMKKMINDNICGYKKKEITPKKNVLSYINSLPDCQLMEKLILKTLSTGYNNESYLRDLVTISETTKNRNYSPLSLKHRTKHLDYMFNQHLIFKALISLNTISSKRYRLVQTTDPNTLLVMLPNADALTGAPLRFFTINILTKEEETDTINLNKLLGIYAGHLVNNSNTIMISKVISLDMSRIKMLSMSFAKYVQLTTYYETLNSLDDRVKNLAILLTNMVTLSSLSITDTFKNIMMVCYSTFSNPDDLIREKLECRPTNMSHIFILKRIFHAIKQSSHQRAKIIMGIKSTKINNDGNDLIDTGFDLSCDLEMPLSGIKTNNPKEIFHESYILFYLGNKGLHGSPQELLNLYSIPLEFEEEFTNMISKYKSVIKELNNNEYGFEYKALNISTKLVYSQLASESLDLRNNIRSNLSLDQSILTKKQFTSTKSMVDDNPQNIIVENISEVKNLQQLEMYIKNCTIDNPNQFMQDVNEHISILNKRNMDKNKTKALFFGMSMDVRGKYNKIPEVSIKYIKNQPFIVFKDFKKDFYHHCGTNFMNHYNGKVFDVIIKENHLNKFETLRDYYNSDYLDKRDLKIRIFYKDQRSYNDREIYTGNLSTRLCLYPLEQLFTSINKRLPEEAITLQGEKKHKKMMDQRIEMVKKRKQYNRNNVYKSDIISVSSDASKWSARDIFLKFIIPISTCPFITSEEKYFYLYLCIKYHKKFILLTDNAYFNAIRFHNEDNNRNVYEKLTNNYTSNSQLVRSNWLQGNLNATSSFIHYCSSKLLTVMLEVINKKYDMNNQINFMVHSDDSVYDILILKKNEDYIMSKYTGTFIYSLLQWSTTKHCITINTKKTYMSNFYKEFLSTLIIGNELFYFYLSDVLPISSDVTYDSPLDDLASYSGYINNAYLHACPYKIIESTILLVNHLTLSTYNLNISSKSTPYNDIFNDDSTFYDVPIQILPRYKLPIDLGGLVPFYCGDAFKIMNRISGVLFKNHTSNQDKMYHDLFNIDLIKKYLDAELDKSFINYIKMCVLCTNSEMMLHNPEDPFDLSDKDLSRQSIIDVLPHINPKPNKVTYSSKIFKSNENYYRLKSCINPIWSICNPEGHDNIQDKIISNYSDKKFVDSLIFQKPQVQFARRIIHSNAKIYRYSLEDTNNLYSIQDIYDRIKNESLNVNLEPAMILNYINLYLFTDQNVSSAIHLYYHKKEWQRISRNELNYKVTSQTNIYPKEFGLYSITTLIRDLIIENSPIDIDKIDKKAETLIDISEKLLNPLKDNIKIYEYPEDIDEPFKDYVNFKYNGYEKLTDILIKKQEIDNDYNMRIYNIKTLFLSLMVKYYNDMKRRLENEENIKIKYHSPRTILLSVNNYMKREIASSKLNLTTKRINKIDEYMLDKFGLYTDPNCYVKYKLDHRVTIIHDRLKYFIDKESVINDEINFLSVVKSRCPYFFEENRYKLSTNNRTWNNIMQNYKNPNNLNKCLFLYSNNYIKKNDIINTLVNSTYIQNYWSRPHSSNYKGAQATYHLSGCFMNIQSMDVGNNKKININFYKPNPQYRLRVNYNNIKSRLLDKIRMDFRDDIHDAFVMSHKNANNNAVYINGPRLTMQFDPKFKLLCNINDLYYNDLRVNVEHDNETDRLLYKLTIKAYTDITFYIKEKYTMDINKIYEFLTEHRGQDYYTLLYRDLDIYKKLPDTIGHEYKYLEADYISDLLDSISNYEVNSISDKLLIKSTKLYGIVNTLEDKIKLIKEKKEIEKSIIEKMEETLYKLSSVYLPYILHNDSISGNLEANIDLSLASNLVSKISISPDYHKEVINTIPLNETNPFPILINKCFHIGGSSLNRLFLSIYYIIKYYYNHEVTDEDVFD
ncbi:RNA-dependent RNA polymerase [Arceuthobium sichuanense virus 1]|uniref:RNA-directed RNA polymerase L n=1 Tax=Arceuthobium sichuanense-associated virus 1 TaxID=3070160 RepID=A0AA48SEQ9_9VIRU|nr:RNA-dependent RNA polymerase [Arceuthobium sichuanense virus 1]DAZ87272.1 TPA_asm: RNA-dependent RNA polymerase [Arceuthobium sichuanense-associated virus 1]